MILATGGDVLSLQDIAQFWNPATDAGRAALGAMITRQAQIIAYIGDFKVLMIATLVVIRLLIVFKQASGGGVRITRCWWNNDDPQGKWLRCLGFVQAK